MTTAPAQQAADRDVIIVGGGIGGLSSAYALTAAGHRVRVLEQAPTFAEVGAGLQLGPNATRILREWGLLDDVTAAGVLPRRLVLKDALDGTELTRLELGRDFLDRYGAPYVVIHRSDLLDILYRACQRAGVELVTNARVLRVENGAAAAAAVTDDGVHRGGLVLAADGLWSTLRASFSADEPVCSGYVAYRGAIPLSEAGDLGELALNDVVVYFGPGCHFVQYTLRQGDMLNQVAVFASPSYQLGAEDWGGPAELDAVFSGCCPQVKHGTAKLGRERRWPMFDRYPISNWTQGRLALTGDAAHPMLQYLAQGACQAIEDAWTLARYAPARGPGGPAEWQEPLITYEKLRTERTAQVQRTARSWGDMWHCDGLTRALRNELLRDRDPADYKHIDWLYSEAVECGQANLPV
ncbi:MAG TPA: FAD-dependent oxidoreductase [Streptosporangiaceae bacterium]|nr:FAD-dependent oxidoreductase [Streptosporangiaceae bacterium]